jgi:hypothetical protein
LQNHLDRYGDLATLLWSGNKAMRLLPWDYCIHHPIYFWVKVRRGLLELSGGCFSSPTCGWLQRRVDGMKCYSNADQNSIWWCIL